MKIIHTAVMAALFVSTAFASPISAAELTVEIKGIAQDAGKVSLAIYNQADKWMKRSLVARSVDAKKEGVSVTFRDLAEGEYAIAIYHDENGNGKLDANLVGMPIEPYAFSNDAAGNFGPPTFEQSKFKLDAEKKSIVINFK
jgi:uncharacterized protein (DUF2141 family)